MILPSFVLPSRVNQTWTESGMDSLELCRNKQHFKSYPHKIEYKYNSRGYRDQEWPESITELQDAIWCFGDSFTVGLGNPEEHIWPNLLSQHVSKRCINVSMDGASNYWIYRKAREVIETINPKLIVIQWSYLHRFELPNTELPDEDRRKQHNRDEFTISAVAEEVDNFYKLFNDLGNLDAIIHTIIPNSGFPDHTTIHKMWNNVRGTSWPMTPPASISEFEQLPFFVSEEMLKMGVCEDVFAYATHNGSPEYIKVISKLYSVEQLDYARDYHHYSINTAKKVVDYIIKSIGE